MGSKLRHCVFLMCVLLLTSAAYQFEKQPSASESSRADRLRAIVSNLAAKLTADQARLYAPNQQQQRQQLQQRPSPSPQHQLPKEVDPAELYQLELQTSTTSSSGVTSEDLNGVIPRQQGWLTSLGKRQEALDYDVGDYEDPFDPIEEDIIKKQKRQQGWQTLYGKRDIGDVIGYDVTPFDDKTDEVSKRQQGWYSPYGKRTSSFGDNGDISDLIVESNADLPEAYKDNVVLNGIAQTLKPAEGKREVGFPTFMTKRQQGWLSTYGKRGTDILDLFNKRQQGWHSAYGKRDASPVLPSNTGQKTEIPTLVKV